MSDITMGRIVQINLLDRIIECDIRLPLTSKMSENFTLAEMVDPTTNKLIFCPQLLEITQQARTETGCTIVTTNGLSWFRGELYNQKVGGADKSYHLYGQAHDSKWYYQGNQVHPLHCAYEMLERVKARNWKCEIGVYLPKYDGSSTGYMHFAVCNKDHLYYFDKKGKHEIQSLKEISLP